MPTRAALCLLCLALFTLAGCQGRERSLPLYYRGGEFVAAPVESAESIVLRANRLEQDAIVSACLGYANGTNGFPKLRYVAESWASVLYATGEVRESELLFGYLEFLWQSTRFHSIQEAQFIFAGKSKLAPALLRAGIFAHEVIRPEGAGPPSADGTTFQWLHTDMTALIHDYVNAVLAGKAPPDTAEFFNSKYVTMLVDKYGPEVVLIHAATVGQEFPMRPDWNSEYIWRFILEAGEKQLWGKVGEAAAVYGARLMQNNDNAVKALLKKAHAGDAEAEQLVAASYYSGAPGFLRSSNLGGYWLMPRNDEDKLLPQTPKYKAVWLALLAEITDYSRSAIPEALEKIPQYKKSVLAIEW